nr:Eco29kI family restriction endonuclease [Pseudomonas azotoformans]
MYAINYTGDFPACARLASLNQNGQFMLPIYVGKAVPAVARMGGDLGSSPGKVLHKR